MFYANIKLSNWTNRNIIENRFLHMVSNILWFYGFSIMIFFIRSQSSHLKVCNACHINNIITDSFNKYWVALFLPIFLIFCVLNYNYNRNFENNTIIDLMPTYVTNYKKSWWSFHRAVQECEYTHQCPIKKTWLLLPNQMICKPVFGHGKYYVACSLMHHPNDLINYHPQSITQCKIIMYTDLFFYNDSNTRSALMLTAHQIGESFAVSLQFVELFN